jgi:hypothetical protein
MTAARSARAWSKAGSRWTHELIAYALDRYHRRHLRTPTTFELRQGIEGLPSYPTIRRIYGSVGRMYHMHGYCVRKAGGQPGRSVSMKRDAAGRFLPNNHSVQQTQLEVQ